MLYTAVKHFLDGRPQLIIGESKSFATCSYTALLYVLTNGFSESVEYRMNGIPTCVFYSKGIFIQTFPPEHVRKLEITGGALASLVGNRP